jgi:hypothetical protein
MQTDHFNPHAFAAGSAVVIGSFAAVYVAGLASSIEVIQARARVAAIQRAQARASFARRRADALTDEACADAELLAALASAS